MRRTELAQRAVALEAQLEGMVGGWVSRRQNHLAWREAPVSRLLAEGLEVVGVATRRIPPYALGLGRFFTIAAALDTGSAFEGMGGAREATFSCLAEPAVFFGMLVLARASGTYSLSDMMGPAVSAMWTTSSAALAAVLVSWFVVLLAVEPSRGAAPAEGVQVGCGGRRREEGGCGAARQEAGEAAPLTSQTAGSPATRIASSKTVTRLDSVELGGDDRDVIAERDHASSARRSCSSRLRNTDWRT